MRGWKMRGTERTQGGKKRAYLTPTSGGYIELHLPTSCCLKKYFGFGI